MWIYRCEKARNQVTVLIIAIRLCEGQRVGMRNDRYYSVYHIKGYLKLIVIEKLRHVFNWMLRAMGNTSLIIYNKRFQKYFCNSMACKAQKECIPLETDLDGFKIAFTWDSYSWDYDPTIKKSHLTHQSSRGIGHGWRSSAQCMGVRPQMFQIMGPTYALDEV